MKESKANSRIMHRTQVRSNSVELYVQEFSEAIQISREDLIAGVEGAAKGNCCDPKEVIGRLVQVALKLLNSVVHIFLDGFFIGRSLTSHKECNAICGETQIRLT